MASTADRFKEDLNKLKAKGTLLGLALDYLVDPKRIETWIKSKSKDPAKGDGLLGMIKSTNFRQEYQTWYSEARAVIKAVLPDREKDFVSHYEIPKGRKELDAVSYRIEDALHGHARRFTGLNESAAVSHLQQQNAILDAAIARFESSLFQIRQLMQADLFESELAVAKELRKNGFLRPAGAIAGVVLERHLRQVREARGIKIEKRKPMLNDLNEALRQNGVYDQPMWRFVGMLSDIRNLCDHAGEEPKDSQIGDLIEGVARVMREVG